MGMTITERILARAAGREKVQPGEIIYVDVDRAMTQDILGAMAFPAFRELGIPVWDREKIVMIVDHCAPPSTLLQAGYVVENIRFAKDYGIKHFYKMRGVCHQILPEEGFVRPGAVIVGTDSHTTTYGALGAFSTGIGSTEMVWVFAKGNLWLRVPETIRIEITGQLPPMVMAKDVMLKFLSLIGTNGANYKALEYGGQAVRKMSMDGRLTLCNMAVEAGAKNGIVEVDEITQSYLKDRVQGEMELWKSDPDANYSRVLQMDINALDPQVACPHSPANVVPIGEVIAQKVDQVLIGTCTGGRLEDFRMAARLIRGNRISRNVRCLIIPASARIYLSLLEEGLLKVFAEAGCVISNPQCGPCAGVQHGLLGDGEICVSTSNRNFMGRMGSTKANVYLASPATAAAAAVAGVLTDPRSLEGGK